MPHDGPSSALGFSRYQRSILTARNLGLALSIEQQRRMQRLVRRYADELADRAARLYEARLDERLRIAANQIANALIDDIERRVGSGVRITAREIRDIHARAVTRLLAQNDRGGIPVGFASIDVGAAAAVLSRPELSRAFVSIRRESVDAVDEIITESLIRGVDTRQFAARVRHHIIGADFLPERFLDDRRRISYRGIEELMGLEPTRENLLRIRHAAGRISRRAQLIARTETMNAEWEAARMAAEDSPVVDATRWNLSARHPEPDECDVLAATDFYGIGAGVYPAAVLPNRPHPRCICYMTHVLRPVEDWGTARDEPALVVDPADAAEAADLTPSSSRSLRDAMLVGQARRSTDPDIPTKPIRTRGRTWGGPFEGDAARDAIPDLHASIEHALRATAAEQTDGRINALRPLDLPPGFDEKARDWEIGAIRRWLESGEPFREDAAAWNLNGSPLSLTKQRTYAAVSFPNAEAEMLGRGIVLTHTHPPLDGQFASPFSAGDVAFAAKIGASEMRVIAPVPGEDDWAVVHRIHPSPELGFPSMEATSARLASQASNWDPLASNLGTMRRFLEVVMHQIEDEFRAEFERRTGHEIPPGVQVPYPAWTEIQDAALRIMFARLGVHYSREIVDLREAPP